MSKIAKFIKSALNNSSANEAAQALKMAAATMQKEGLNPAEFLQEKGAANDSAALQDALDTIEGLETLLAARERDLEAAQRKAVNSAELREAKELAIKWHKIAQDNDQQVREIARAAAAARELEKTNYNNAVTWKNRFIWTATGLGLVLAFAFMNLNTTHNNYSAAQAAPAVEYRTDEATCYIQGENTKFWFSGGKVNRFENGKNTAFKDFGAAYDRSQFLNDVNKDNKGKADCKLGVNE